MFKSFFKYLQTLIFFSLFPLYCNAEGVLEYLSAAAYGIKHEKCSDFNTDVVPSLIQAGKSKGCTGAYNLDIGQQAQYLKKASEELFFDISKIELTEQLNCQIKKNDQFISNLENINDWMTDIQTKAPAIIELTSEIEKRISQFQLLQGQIPKNLNGLKVSDKVIQFKANADILNNEIKSLIIQKQLIIESIPMGKNIEFSKMIEGLSEKDIQDDQKMKKLIIKSSEKMRTNLNNDFKHIGDMKRHNNQWPREFKERIADNPEFIQNLVAKNKMSPDDFESLRCEIDSKYGVGAKIRDQIAFAGFTVVTAGVGLAETAVLRAPVVLNRLEHSRRLMMLSSSSFVLNAGQIALAVKNQCNQSVPKNLLYSDGGSDKSCEQLDIKRQVIESNCALSVALPIFSVTTSGFVFTTNTKKLIDELKKNNAVNTLKSEIDTKQIMDFHKAFRLEQEQTLIRNQTLTANTPAVTKNHYQNYQDLLSKGQIEQAQIYEKKLSNILQNDKMEFVGDIGVGIAGAKYVKFPDGTLGIWKSDKMGEYSLKYGANSEIMAYKVDKKLDLNRVPITVPRKLNDTDGTVQLMVGDLKKSELVNYPNETKLFDDLISNSDRHNKNYLLTNDGRLVAIDHGMASKKYLIQSTTFNQDVAEEIRNYDVLHSFSGGDPVAKIKTINMLSSMIGEKKSYLKLKNTTDAEWTALLKPDMNNTRIEQFLKRRQEIVKTVENARKKFGDDVFLSGKTSPARITQPNN